MPPPNESLNTGDIAVGSTSVFGKFADDMESSVQSFNGLLGAASTAAANNPGMMNESKTLTTQLEQAAGLRVAYIDATRTGVEGYKSALTAIGAKHEQLGFVTTSVMEGILTVRSSKDGDN